MKMKKTFFNYIKLTLALFLFLQAGSVEAQNNLTMQAYGLELGGGGITIDVLALDAIFGTVTINGTVVTGIPDYTASLEIKNLPTSVAGFGTAQVVWVTALKTAHNLSKAQADALIAYVKNGGVLIGNIEGSLISTLNDNSIEYIGEALFCTTTYLTATAADSTGPNPTQAYHPGNGALLLNSSSATFVNTTGSYSQITGVPSQNIIFAANATASCGSVPALDFVVPAYPGIPNSCNVKGMALLSGEVQGILGYNSRKLNTQSNQNYAQLIYDFLYTPSAMSNRLAWSSISTNKNTTCPPALPPCNAGTTGPTLSSATINNSTCATAFINLNSLVISATPSGASLVWYTNNTRTGNPVADPTKVATSGTYYAFYNDATNNCYSPASSPVTASYTACPVNISNTCPTSSSVDLANSLESTNVVPEGYTLTFHSGTPATTANKISSIVTTSGTYYGAYYLPGQDCYTETSRKLVVTIKNCCDVLPVPTWN